MVTRKTHSSREVNALLEDMLVDADGDDEQLWALREVIAGALDLPTDVHVVGEPLSLVAVDYDGNSRRGLVGRCRREGGREFQIGLADVMLPPDAAGLPCLAAYCRWLGVKPATLARGLRTETKLRRHKASDDDIDLSKPVDLVVLAVKERAARCRLLDSERVITLRAGSLHKVVPGQIATVTPRKHWRRSAPGTISMSSPSCG